MPIFVVSAQMDATLEWSLPSASTVDSVFHSVALDVQGEINRIIGPYLQNIGVGGWIGAPRIVRQNLATGYKIICSGLWQIADWIPDDVAAARFPNANQGQLDSLAQSYAEAVISTVARLINERLTHTDDQIWRTVWSLYNARINGEMAFWETGQASRTNTRDRAPTAAGLTAQSENPVGPSARDLRPDTGSEIAQRAIDSAAGAGVPLIVGGIILVIVLMSAKNA